MTVIKRKEIIKQLIIKKQNRDFASKNYICYD